MEDLSPAKFADSIGIQRSGISHLLAGRNKPSFDFITKMLAAYPDLNADWLLTGKGKPYKNSAQIVPSLPENDTLFNSAENSDETFYTPEVPESELFETDETNPQPSENPIFPKRSIVRVTIFYSDGTYEEK